MKPGYITMTWRESNNGGIAKICSPQFFGIETASSLLSSKGPNYQCEYHSSLLMQMKDILKEKCRRKFTKGVLFLHDNALAHWALATQKKLAYLGF